MPSRSHNPWVPRFLFRVTVLVSAALILLVFLSPWLDNGEAAPAGAARLAAVFARDRTMRRTAIAGAVGLLATAWIFFRRPGGSRSFRRPKPPRTPPSQTIAGA